MSTQLQTIEPASRMDAGISKSLEQKYEEFLAEAKLNGNHDAIMFTPSESDPLIHPYIERITNNFNYLKLLAKEMSEPGLQQKLGSVELEDATKENTTREKEIEQRKSDCEKNQRLYRDKPVFWPLLIFSVFTILSLGIAFGEGTLIADALQTFQSSYQAAIISAVALSVTLFVLAHAAPPFIQAKVKSHTMQRFWNGVLIGIILTVFIGLSIARSKFLLELHGTETSPVLFALWSSLLFMGLYLTAREAMTMLPAVKEAFDTIRKRKALRKELSTIKQMEAEVKSLKDELKEKLKDRLILITASKTLDAKIDAWYLKAVSAYKNSNLNKRVDGVLPQCFSQAPKPLNTYTDEVSM